MRLSQLPTLGLQEPNRQKRLVETVNQITKAPVWIAPTLLNTWVDYGSGHSPIGYYKDALGRVHIRGLIRDGTDTALTDLFALPAGYRPAYRMIFGCVMSNAADEDTSDNIARVDVAADGTVEIVHADCIWLALDGISFLAEQ